MADLKMAPLVWHHNDSADAPKVSGDSLKQLLNSLYGSNPPTIEDILTDEKEISTMASIPRWLRKQLNVQSPSVQINCNLNMDETNEGGKEPEEWIWVDGYKGTRKDMTCNGYQYIMNQQHNMEEGAEIKACRSGFHLCKALCDVYHYYEIGHGNRFFKVKALVRKTDYERCRAPRSSSLWALGDNKLAAKSIIFERELTVDEIFNVFSSDISEDWSTDDKLMALEHDIDYVRKYKKNQELIILGYSELMAKYIAKDSDKHERAVALASQPGLSMDVKILAIFCGDDD